MRKIGIIANPASGKDIRRLVAYADIVDNREKVNLIRRIILGIDSTGVEEILMMPDYYNLGEKAISGLKRAHLQSGITVLDMPVSGTQDDSTRAMRLMKEQGVNCTVTLGGDGTNRAIAKGDCTTPVVPVSTGTNNVFPVMIEATTAGIAAGIIAQDFLDNDTVTYKHKRLIINRNNQEVDMALVDVVILEQPFVGARAVWKMSEVKEIFCTRAEPGSIGLSSIGGSICPISPKDDTGLYVRLGKGNITTKAAVLPGMIQDIDISDYRKIDIGETINLNSQNCLIALDGEREITVGKSDNIRVKLKKDGPRVVDIGMTINTAANKGFFIKRKLI